MDDNFRELEREAFESAFKGDDAAPADASYGIDPRQADAAAMAEAFDSPDVVVGKAMTDKPIQGEALPAADAPAESPAAPEPAAPVSQSAAEVAKPEFKTFGQAFKYHREQAANGGPKVFEWNGKQFTTQLKSEVGSVAKKPQAAKSKPASDVEKFEGAFQEGDKPAVDRSKALAFREAAAKQPVNLNEDPARMRTVDEMIVGVARAGKVAPDAPAKKDGKPWYQAGPKNTFIRNGDDPKNGPIYSSKRAGDLDQASEKKEIPIYRGKGTSGYKGELS